MVISLIIVAYYFNVVRKVASLFQLNAWRLFRTVDYRTVNLYKSDLRVET